MIKLVVFDWNGTLLADTQIVLEGHNRQMKAFGKPPLSLLEFQNKREVPLRKLYQNVGIDMKLYESKATQIIEEFHAYYEPRASKARTRQGTRQLLVHLKKSGIESIILSNHTVEGIYFQLERLKLTHFFSHILANDNVHESQNIGKEQRLHKFLDSNKQKPEETVIIGDTEEEIGIGKRLGLKTIVISGGYNSVAQLKSAKPDVLVHSLHEIIPAIEEF